MTRLSYVVLTGSGSRDQADRRTYGAERQGEAGSRVGVTKPTRAKRKARRRR